MGGRRLCDCLCGASPRVGHLGRSDDTPPQPSLFLSNKSRLLSSTSSSKLCVGRVWHTRFHPKKHSFTYPIFMVALDLLGFEQQDDNDDDLDHAKTDGKKKKKSRRKTTHRGGGSFSMLWPIVRFRPDLYHLKNGEGLHDGSSSSQPQQQQQKCRLSQRIFDLVAEKTQQKFRPTPQTHRIVLLTHLEYYGYNFNPVSFYYLLSRDDTDPSGQQNKNNAIVGEVSNTPWTEMYCYVLHPDSVDQVQVQRGSKKDSDDDDSTTLSYRFPKTFHVSPFMEMDYWYDWRFEKTPLNDGADDDSSSSFVVVNSLRRRTSTDEENEQLQFTARLELQAQPITPYALAWQVIRFPIFCVLIQVWIHYQAAWLFLKGVAYIPHPQGSETRASQIIATIMIPFFTIRDYLNGVTAKSKEA